MWNKIHHTITKANSIFRNFSNSMKEVSSPCVEDSYETQIGEILKMSINI